MDARGFPDAVAGFVVETIAPLREALADLDLFDALLRDLGWPPTEGPIDLGQIRTYLGFEEPLDRITELIAKIRTGTPDPLDVTRLTESVAQLVARLREVSSRAAPQGLPPPLSDANFWPLVGEHLLNSLVIRSLADHRPVIYGALHLIGIIEERETFELGKPPTALRWDRLSTLLRDPTAVMADVHGWTKVFKYREVIVVLEKMLREMGLDAWRVPAALDRVGRYYGAGTTTPDRLAELWVPIVSHEDPDVISAWIEIGLLILPVPAATGGVPAGLIVTPYATGRLAAETQVSETTVFRVQGTADAGGGAGVRLLPGAASAFSETGAAGALRFELARTSSEPLVLVGGSDGSRATVGSVSLALDVSVTGGSSDVGIELNLRQGELVIAASEGDAFLRKVLPAEPLTIPFDLTLGVSATRGVHVSGSTALEKTFPVHKTLFDVVTIESTYLSLRTRGAEVSAVAALSASVKLGPVTAAIDRIGFSTNCTFPQGGGNLGPANVTFAFKPPDGAGLAIDAGAIVGGGYLFFDDANQQYAGILQLEIQGGIALKAIGLLTTRLPDGSAGFSLLVIIFGEFTPIPLGFGFTLNGVGGLFGVNRTMNLEPLRAGIKNQTLDGILFPKDPVANAQRIISDLQAIFPPAAQRYVFGPMARVGWGTPTILTIEVAIVLELPWPARLLLVGRLRMILPDEKAALVLLRMDVAGSLDPDKGELAIDAVLYDSRVGMFSLSGGMALRVSWGANPNFVLAAGGLNPRMPVPAGFPTLDRLAISLAAGDNPRIRLESYFALTSNTVQFGANLDLYAQAETFLGLFSLQLYVGFDALIHFKPFHFIIDLELEVALKRNGEVVFAIQVNLALSGPDPWLATGRATFHFLGKVEIPIAIRIGEEREQESQLEVSPLRMLQEALGQAGNWAAELVERHMHVTLRDVPAPATAATPPTAARELFVHPLGSLTVRQKIVPLKLEIAKVGTARPDSPGPFVISRVWLGEQEERERLVDVRDYFAPAQFVEMNDEEKLAAPAFQSLVSGMSIESRSISHGTALNREIEYDEVVMDQERTLSIVPFTFGPDVVAALTNGGAAAFAAMRETGPGRFAGPRQPIAVRDVAFDLARRDDLKAARGEQVATPSGPTQIEASQARQRTAARGMQVQVVPTHHVAA
jgi:hypothetical protein